MFRNFDINNMNVLKQLIDVKMVGQIGRIFNNGKNSELNHSVFDFIITVIHHFNIPLHPS